MRSETKLHLRRRGSTSQEIKKGKEAKGSTGRLHNSLKGLIGLATVVAITALFPRGDVYHQIDLPHEGDISKSNIIAPFTFDVLKGEEELKTEKERVTANVPLVLVLDVHVTDEGINKLKAFFDQAERFRGLPDVEKINALAEFYPQLSTTALHTVLRKEEHTKIQKSLTKWLDELASKGVLDSKDGVFNFPDQLVTLQRYGNEITVTQSDIVDLPAARQELAARAMATFQEHITPTIAEIGSLFAFANLRVDEAETERRIEAALGKISKTTGFKVQKDEMIIAKHEKVTKEHVDKLRSLAIAQTERDLAGRAWKTLLPILGRALIVAFVVLLLSFYFYLFNRRLFEDNRLIALVAVTIILGCGFVFVGAEQLSLSEYLIPMAIASILITIIFDAHIGIVVTITLGILAGLLRNFDFSITFITIVSGTVAAYSVIKVRHRHQFYRPMLYLSLSYVALAFTVETLKFTPPMKMLEEAGFGILNGFLSPLLAMGLLPVFESIFSVTTDITLLELSDLNRPLMRRLAVEASGTYHHSVLVGNLAEAAAEAIGANSLLARVAAYYHDVGKLVKPDYFVENQTDGKKNPHDKLNPSMSGLILSSHVKDGVELATKEGLPQLVKDIIQQHHGTTVMNYFYQKALDQGAGPEVKEEFRYPGPRPQTREAAIVMLADSVEASSRTLKEATPSRLRGLVNAIIETSFAQGELDNCDITLKELHRIAESFHPILMGIFHPRVEYPSMEATVSRSRKTTHVRDQKHEDLAGESASRPETERGEDQRGGDQAPGRERDGQRGGEPGLRG